MRFGLFTHICRFAEAVPLASLTVVVEQRHMTIDQSCQAISVDEIRAKFLRLAEQADERAAVYDEQARLYEEAGIVERHPSAHSLRAGAQEARTQAGQLRKSAATLA